MLRSVIAAPILAALAAGSANAGIPVKFTHVIIVVQENRTPDNIFGSNPHFEPGVDIASSGTTSTGATVALTPVPLASCYDVDHRHAAFVTALTKGFDTEGLFLVKDCPAPANAQFKYADNSTGTMQPYFDIATANGFANRMFQTNQGPSFPAHQFLFGGTSAPTPFSSLFVSDNPFHKGPAGCTAALTSRVSVIDYLGNISPTTIYPCLEHTTLSDLLDTAKIGWRYYTNGVNSVWTAPDAINHICVPKTVGSALACTGADWVDHVVANNPAQVLTDIQSCNLQPVSWVIPDAPASDHAQVNKGLGPAWVASIVNAVGTQTCGGDRYWANTVIFVTWDDWGGWFDHVRPFKVTTPYSWGSGYTYGFRVPLLVVSAYTRTGTVSNAIYDFGSILDFVERNFDLGYIGTSTHNRYADYWAAQAGRGEFSEFFTRTSPRPFVQIPAALTAKNFIEAPPSNLPLENDND